MLCNTQAGFRNGNSTAQILHAYTCILQKAKSTGTGIHVSYLDIQKAFDSVPFWAIRQTLKMHKLSNSAIEMIMALYPDDLKLNCRLLQTLE
jgi:hypothetical protein